MASVAVDDSGFEAEVLGSDVPVIVDFWAAWCGPCRMIAPILEELSDEYKGKIKVAKVNVDTDQEWAAKLGVRGIPVLYLFKDGELVGNRVGAASKSAIKEWVDQSI